MTSIRKLALALFSAICFSSLSNAQEITTQTHSISDDGYANVPLQFDFSYYGQTFNNSWMFSNGIISFQDPNQSGLNGLNLSVQPMSSAMGNQFNYSIFPLWTDLINISGTFRTDGTENYQQYSWIGISPFYDANRLNTFTVEIKPDGSISANYSLIDIDYGQIGLTGNTSLGEFDHIASLGRTTSLTNWERITQGTTPPPSEDPCIADPLSSPSCPGYTQNLLSLLPTTTQPVLETISSTPESTIEVSSPIVQQPVAQSSTPAELAPAATAPAITESQSSGSRVSTSTILSIIGNEQSRIAGVERSTVEASIDQATREAERSTQQAEATASAAVSESVSVSISSAQSQMTLDQQQANASAQSSGGGLSFFSATSLSTSSFNSSIDQNEERNKSAVSFSGFSAVNVLNEDTTVSDNETQKEQKTDTVRQGISNNELAGNVTLASLGAIPQGFNAYSTMMPDAPFYAPKEIYKNQRVVDSRAGRRMFGGSDALHEEMVNQQYK
jgi:hypothetical protein